MRDEETDLVIVEAGVHDAVNPLRRLADVAAEKDGMASFDALCGRLARLKEGIKRTSLDNGVLEPADLGIDIWGMATTLAWF